MPRTPIGETAGAIASGRYIEAGDRAGGVAKKVAIETGPGAVAGGAGKLAGAVGNALRAGDEVVDIFRAVGKAEHASIEATGKFSMGAGQEMKQFGLSAKETTDFASRMNSMPSGEGYSAIVKGHSSQIRGKRSGCDQC